MSNPIHACEDRAVVGGDLGGKVKKVVDLCRLTLKASRLVSP